MLDQIRRWRLARKAAQEAVVPEWQFFDYWGHQHVVNHVHSYLYASQFAEGADVLGAGCGSGYGTEMLASYAGGGDDWH